MSRSSLLRKCKKQTQLSASQFIRQIRLEEAMELLQEFDLTVSEVSYRVGFGSTSYFIKCFREHYGYPPGEVSKTNFEEIFSKRLSLRCCGRRAGLRRFLRNFLKNWFCFSFSIFSSILMLVPSKFEEFVLLFKNIKNKWVVCLLPTTIWKNHFGLFFLIFKENSP